MTTSISKEKLEEYLRCAIQAVEEFWQDEYSSNKNCRPGGMTMKEYDELFGLDRFTTLRDDISRYQTRLEEAKEKGYELVVKHLSKEIDEMAAKLRNLEQEYDK